MSTPQELIQEAQELCAVATPGPWRWWTSCSHRRLSSDAMGGDGDVLRGVVQAHDRHPDVRASEEDKAFIARSRVLVEELTNALTETIRRAEHWEPLARERLDMVRDLERKLKQAAAWEVLAQDRADEIRKLQERLAQCAEPEE